MLFTNSVLVVNIPIFAYQYATRDIWEDTITYKYLTEYSIIVSLNVKAGATGCRLFHVYTEFRPTFQINHSPSLKRAIQMKATSDQDTRSLAFTRSERRKSK